MSLITFDPAKSSANAALRGLPFSLVKELDWSTAIMLEDTRHDYGEQRFRVFGYIGSRLYAAVITPRTGSIHVISLRKANRREQQRYG